MIIRQIINKPMFPAEHYVSRKALTDYMYQEKREEEDLPASKSALTHRDNGSTTTRKHERGLITAIRKDTDNTTDDTMTITRKQK